jgi:hypothetical protein
MTCQECELKLGMGEDAADHLASCKECRALAEELRLNAVALHEMRARPVMSWLAMAAAILLAIAAGWKMTRVEKLPLPVVRMAGSEPKTFEKPAVLKVVKHRPSKRRSTETLRVKLLTSDPDVVIYWIVDKKDGYE